MIFFSIYGKTGPHSVYKKISLLTSNQAVRNRAINVMLKSSKADEYQNSFQQFLTHFHVETDHLVREKMLLEQIEQEVASLPKRMRTVFEPSRKDGLSHKEIAEQLNISEQSARSHVKGALKTLRLRLGAFILLYFISGIY